MIFRDTTKKRKKILGLAALLIILLMISCFVEIIFEINLSEKNYVSPPLIKQKIHIREKKIALSFDDGPERVHTLAIVNTLKTNNIPATFFFTGINIINNRSIVKKVFDEGFEIGNHTFTHSLNVHQSQKRLKWELGTTRKIIESITGERVWLYRPPFLLDIDVPSSRNFNQDELPRKWVKDLGYQIVGANIDPKDWTANSSKNILSRVKLKLTKESSHSDILLLHDHAAHTVAALETIINYLRFKGYSFVTVSDLYSFKKPKHMIVKKYSFFQDSLNYISNKIINFILICIENFDLMIKILLCLFAFKVTVFFVLLMLNKKFPNIQTLKNVAAKKSEMVSLLIPVYNEENSITCALESVLGNDYLPDEIIVIDDGSTDSTADMIKSFIRRCDNKIKMVKIQNSGKAFALNVGLSIAKHEVIITLDGDTVFKRNTIECLLRHFVDKNVGAVAGKIEVIAPPTVLGGLQIFEYIVEQNVRKKALGAIHVVDVVPGSVSAWRKSDLLECGGFSADTLVEDRDLTFALLQKNKKIVYDPDAVSYSEMPHTLKNFLKQRFRWTFGTMQCCWKYRKFILNKNAKILGWIILPDVIFNGILLPLISPIMDIIFLIFIFINPNVIFSGFFFFFLLYLLYILVGFWTEKDKINYIILFPIYYLFYKFTTIYIILKCIIFAAKGERVLWNKVERNGFLQKYYSTKKLEYL